MAQTNRISAEILRVRRAYRQALTEGDSKRAAEALAGGLHTIGLKRLYLEVLAPAQASLGEKWLKGRDQCGRTPLGEVAHLERWRHLMSAPQAVQSTGRDGDAQRRASHPWGANGVGFPLFEGLRVDYLGGNKPTNELVDYVRLRRPAAVGLSVTLKEYLEEAAAAIAPRYDSLARHRRWDAGTASIRHRIYELQYFSGLAGKRPNRPPRSCPTAPAFPTGR